MSIKTTAINKAIAYLNAAGAKFAILAEDGTKFGTLEVQPEKTRTRMFNHVEKHGWTKRFESAKAGDLIEFTCDSKEEARSLQGTLSARLTGSGSIVEYRAVGDEKWLVSALIVKLEEEALA